MSATDIFAGLSSQHPLGANIRSQMGSSRPTQAIRSQRCHSRNQPHTQMPVRATTWRWPHVDDHRSDVVSGVSEAASIAASASSLVGRGRKRRAGAATFIGRRIMLASADRDRALDKLAYEVSEELRALNCTLAAIAISDGHEGARMYLEQVVEAGIEAHHDKARRVTRLAELRTALKEA